MLMLGGVNTLHLSRWNGIKNVSMLGPVHTLNLSYCKGITDVSIKCTDGWSTFIKSVWL